MPTFTHGTTTVTVPEGTAITARLPGEAPIDLTEHVPALLEIALRQGAGHAVSVPQDVLDGVDVHFECPTDAVIVHDGAPVDGQLALVLIGRVVTSSTMDLVRDLPGQLGTEGAT